MSALSKLVLSASLLFSLSSGAVSVIRNADGSFTYGLQNGEAMRGYRVEPTDTVTCGHPNFPNPPPPPVRPQPPACSIGDFQNALYGLSSDAQRAANGKCPRSFSVRYCGNDIEDHAIADVKSGFANSLSYLKRRAEDICRSQCSNSEVRRIADEYRELHRFMATTQIKYMGKSTAMLDNPEMFRLVCY